MKNKALWFRYFSERSGPKKAPGHWTKHPARQRGFDIQKSDETRRLVGVQRLFSPGR
ncbi:MAG: hypothetical protein HY928_15670 [Elusimicrobia bacterium]|nr:hypothetical protein [Elusimicrobiota bacterium]